MSKKHFCCPRCQLEGAPELFEPGWVNRYLELAIKHNDPALADMASMSWNDRRGRYLFHLRNEKKHGRR